jgi:hypothetical protein
MDLEKAFLFSKLTALNISGSSVTDKGIAQALQALTNLKELDVSNCCLLTDQTIKRLGGDKFVNLKLNSLNSVSEEAVLSLMMQSYNLNYLEVRGTGCFIQRVGTLRAISFIRKWRRYTRKTRRTLV